jgi:hypothetical protein
MKTLNHFELILSRRNSFDGNVNLNQQIWNQSWDFIKSNIPWNIVAKTNKTIFRSNRITMEPIISLINENVNLQRNLL